MRPLFKAGSSRQPAKRKDRAVDRIDEVQHEVSNAVESESLDDLDGKLILQRLVEPFEVSTDDLARMAAKELNSMEEQPDF